MKNKKLFARILALCTVTVLLFALALPCFADAPDDVPVGALDAFYQSWQVPDTLGVDLRDIYGDSIFNYYSVSLSKLRPDTDLSFTNPDLYYVEFRADCYIFLPTVEETIITGTDVKVVNWYDDGGSEEIFFGIQFGDGRELVILFVPADSSSTFRLQSVSYGGTTLTGEQLSDVVVFLGFNNIPDYLIDLSILLGGSQESVAYPKEFLRNYEPLPSGLYDQLYSILRDAIYGEDVVLDGAQDFSLTLVTTLLVFVTVLLPVLLVVAIMFKLFRW